MDKQSFTKVERKFIFGISLALGFRQFALTMFVPLIAIYGMKLKGSTPLLAGLSVGIYGLTLALLQVPFGTLSDKFGRKLVMLIGSAFIVIGLLVASLAKNVYVLILGRALQGAGAIHGVSMAWISEYINVEKRNKAIGSTGTILAIATVFGFIFGPLSQRYITMSQLYLGCFLFSIITCFYILIFLEKDNSIGHNKVGMPTYKINISNNVIIRLIIVGFILNYVMTGFFFIVPQLIEARLGIDNLWKVLIPATLLGIIGMRVLMHWADKGYSMIVSAIAFFIVLVSTVCIYIGQLILVAIGMALFMISYIFLASLLPATVSKFAPKNQLGVIQGLLSSLQFFGSFVGGVITGLLWGINKDISIISMSLFGMLGVVMVISLRNHVDNIVKSKFNSDIVQ